ncbi:hypothetical protein [Paenibacillus qinlingensis]|uniref:hypothetical protein n=1 Tax=Paenibacillus qinlingensis TaxID=1837343 RepID=UPI001563EAB2|nr:hypothetical protein [Paenibacillus qinlingensis]NQX63264.1 hypothetical protein [Paenibacillus qinlingensis]
MPNYERIETSESITILNDEDEKFKLALSLPFIEVYRRFKKNPENTIFHLRITNEIKENEEVEENGVSMGFTFEDAEFLHSALTKILRRFKNEEIID